MTKNFYPGMGQAVAERTILRKKEDDRWENWSEVADRVALGNSLLCLTEEEQQKEYKILKKHLNNATTIMSGRHLQHGDATQPERNMEVFTNCCTSAAAFMVFANLANGAGVGRAYDDDMMLINWDNSPNLRCVIDSSHPDYDYEIHETFRDAKHKYGSGKDVLWHEIEDTREGWAKALEIWENATFEKIHKDKTLILDFSKIRAKGTPIKGMQNRPASGPAPLISAFLRAASLKGANLPKWLQAMYIDHYFAECILVGGSRRSSRMSTKTWRDKTIFDFIMVKRPIEYFDKTMKEIKDIRRTTKPLTFLWSSNNSVTVDKEFWRLIDLTDKDTEYNSDLAVHARKVFDMVIFCAYADGTGEPGFINQDQLKHDNTGLDELLSSDYIGSKRYQVEDDTKVYLRRLAKKVKNKKLYMITNPCITKDTNILTSEGWKTVEDLVDKPFMAVVHEKPYSSKGFFKTGFKKVYEIVLENGKTIKATYDHKFLRIDGFEKIWTKVYMLSPGDMLVTDESSSKVKSIAYWGEDDVYDCTVDEIHAFNANGILTHNCGEIALNLLAGYCVIADVVPFHANTLDEAEEAFKATTRALIRVNTMDAYFGKEVKRTNRIGVGMTGVHEFAWKFFKFGFRDLIDEEKSLDFWRVLSRFNKAVKTEAIEYATKLGLNIPHTMTTCKPSGSVSKLWGLTEGVHLPSMAWYLRWVQFHESDPLVKEYQKNGYPVRYLKEYKNTVIVGFPTQPLISTLGLGNKLVVAGEATVEEQYKWLMLLEKYWITGLEGDNYGNQVSFCLAEKEHLVATNQGIYRIENIKTNLSVVDRHGLNNKVIDKIDNGIKQVGYVKLENGVEIIGTHDHKLLTLNENLNFIWKKIKEINVKDIVVRRVGDNIWSTNEFELPNSIEYRSGNIKNPKVPFSVTPDFALFLGMLMADGGLTKNGIFLVNEDKEVLNLWEKLVFDLYGLNCSHDKDERTKNLYNYRVNSRQLSNWLQQDIKISYYHDFNEIPDCILQSPKKQIVSFLKGYTLDGYNTEGYSFLCTTTSKQMAKDMCFLLWNLGYDAYMGHKKGRSYYFSESNQGMGKDQYLVGIPTTQTKYFKDEIGMVEKRKQNNVLINPYERGHKTNSIPAKLFREYFLLHRNEYKENKIEERKIYNFMRANSECITLYNAQKYFYNKNIADELLKDQNLRFTKVTKVDLDYDKLPTYDISIDKSHEYVANSVIVHNTAKYKPELINFETFKATIKKYQPQVKCCSVMPQEDDNPYEYQPEEAITLQEYEHIRSLIKESIAEDVDKAHVDCASGACPIDFREKSL